MFIIIKIMKVFMLKIFIISVFICCNFHFSSSTVSAEPSCAADQYKIQGECKNCDSTCSECIDGNKDGCTRCKKDEYKLSKSKDDKIFKCAKKCESKMSEDIPGRSYKFCKDTSNADENNLNSAHNQNNDDIENSGNRNINNNYNNNLTLILTIIPSLILSIMIVIIGLGLFYKIRQIEKKRYDTNSIPLMNILSNNLQQSIPMSDLDWDKREKIGYGAFGNVYKCKYNSAEGSINVAVKELKNSKHDITQYNEIGALCDVRHPHITKIIGTNLNNGLLLILPLRKYDLQRYLITANNVITQDLHRFSAQIADAMIYLHKKKIIHMDLKASNILVKDEFIVEVSDFGLASFGNEKQGVNGTRTHMALEYLNEVQKEPHKPGDVWSYGVLVWEIYNLCKITPYETEGIKKQLDVAGFLSEGRRLSKPDRLNPELWTIIFKCFITNPSERPNFKSLYEKFAKIIPNTIAVTTTEN